MNQRLPGEFSALEPQAAIWSLATERERHTTRLNAKFEQLQSLYDEVLPRIEEIASYLNQFPMDDLPAQQQNLLHLALSCMEVCLPVEAHGQTTVPRGFEPSRFIVDF